MSATETRDRGLSPTGEPRDADVFTNNLRKGVLERLGLGYEAFRAVNPRIIYAVASGYGDEGPDRTLPSMDIMAQARGGIVAINEDPDGQPAAPSNWRVSDADHDRAREIGSMTLQDQAISLRLDRESGKRLEKAAVLTHQTPEAFAKQATDERARDVLLDWAVRRYHQGDTTYSLLAEETGLGVAEIMYAMGDEGLARMSHALA